MSEINITLFHPPTSKTDAISVQPASTTLADLSNFAMALLGLDDDDGGDGDGDNNNNNGAVLAKGQSRTPLYHPGNGSSGSSGSSSSGNSDGNKTLAQCGAADGEFISAYRISEFDGMLASGGGSGPARQRPRTTAPSNNNNAAAAAGAGGLDFSALFGATSSAAAPPPAAAAAAAGGMDFTALLSTGAAAAASSAATASASSTAASTPATQPVQWDGMNLDEAIGRNPNPIHLMSILSNTTRHPNILKELNYHNPQVFKKLQTANGDVNKMAEIWRQTMMKSTTARFLQNHLKKSKEMEMQSRLMQYPMDEEANKYFGDKIRLENVHKQYEQMMEEYPESMGRVLMLYIDCLVNKKPLIVFVDSGAQNTIMSSACADRLGLLHLVDDRFAGIAVGVGTGKILGKIHMVELEIAGYAFPCSITVMDSEAGLGDKNMDCLFGLDMLKRHRCCIDLGKNVLQFTLGVGGETMEAPFLHEKDLPTNKGGTMGFDAERENAEIEARMDKMETEEEEKEKGSGKMEEEEESAKGDGK